MWNNLKRSSPASERSAKGKQAAQTVAATAAGKSLKQSGGKNVPPRFSTAKHSAAAASSFSLKQVSTNSTDP